jgi:ATP-dependent DNA helicase PIF1
MEWSATQLQVIEDVVHGGKNVFLTGGGGVGKSRVVLEIKRRMLAAKRKIAVTAMTGRAAVNIGGTTFHSFLRLGPHELDSKTPEAIADDKAKNKFFAKDMRAVGLLIVDEVSMMEPRLFVASDIILKRLRDRPEPFGGLQVLFVGDFFQLPPVGPAVPLCMTRALTASASKDADAELPEPLRRAPRFVFQTELFYHLIEETVDLKEVFRQAEASFSELLNRMRRSELSEDDIEVLRGRMDAELCMEDGILPTQLSSNNAQVDSSNERHLAALDAPAVHFKLRSGVALEARAAPSGFRRSKYSAGGGSGGGGGSGAEPEASSGGAGREAALAVLRDKLQKDLNLSPALELKEGAQVMLTINYDMERGLVNGTRGVVVGFSKAVGDRPAATSKTYAADPESVFALDSVEEPYAYPDEPMPIVRFDAPEGSSAPGVKMQVFYYRWQREVPGLGSAYVWQVPLKLAWSSTIHKSQGMSISRVDICLDRKVFEEGQAYVAVSRARSLGGLRFSAFEPSVIRSNPEVLAFYAYPYSTLRLSVLESARTVATGSAAESVSDAAAAKRARA